MSVQNNSIEELKNVFDNLDTKNQGFILKKQFKNAFFYIGDNFDKDIINEEMEKCPDHITFQSFKNIFERSEIQNNRILANQSLFNLYDQAKKGFIDQKDLKRVSEIAGVQLSEQQIEEMLNSEIQKGRVCFDEFSEIMDGKNYF